MAVLHRRPGVVDEHQQARKAAPAQEGDRLDLELALDGDAVDAPEPAPPADQS